MSIHNVMPKMWIILVIIMVFAPSFVEADIVDKTKMPSEFTSSFSLPFEFIEQKTFQKVKIPLVFVDTSNSFVKRLDQDFSGFDLFPLFEYTQSDITTKANTQNTASDGVKVLEHEFNHLIWWLSVFLGCLIVIFVPITISLTCRGNNAAS